MFLAFIIQCMSLARCGVSSARTISCIIFFALFSISATPAHHYDTQGAARAFKDARQKRARISQEAQSSLKQYLECAKAYRLVYMKDPHYGRSGDAIYEEGCVYQEMGDRFGDAEYYKTAAKRFNFLVSDYGGNQNCPDALVRVVDIYSNRLNNRKAAEQAYERLRGSYKRSESSLQQAQELLAKARQPKGAAAKPPATLAILAKPAAEASSGSEISVDSIRYWSTSDYTRVVIDMDRDTRYERFQISNPDRIYFDISNAKLNKDLQNRTFAVGDEFLKQIRVAQYRPDMVRVVLDFAAVSEYSLFELHNPFRLIIDIHGEHKTQEEGKRSPVVSESRPDETGPAVSKPTSAEAKSTNKSAKHPAQSDARQSAPAAQTLGTKAPSAAGSEAPKASPVVTQNEPSGLGEPKPLSAPQLGETTGGKAESKRPESSDTKLPTRTSSIPAAAIKSAPPTSLGSRTLTRVLGLKVGRIVIDPGHGGHDTGTIGPGGLMEKDLVLALAKSLQKMVQEKLGAEVVLTRNDDSFVPLEERTAIANQHRADLFVSIHANSSRVRSISGVETYYLNFAKTAAEREVAARENATAVNNVRDLEDLIKKIAQADKSAESRELAAMLQKRLYLGARQLIPSTHNRGVRSAPFVVLIGANMPSVLAEVAFISNPKDEKLLGKEENQYRLARALFSGVESYIRTLGMDIAHNQQPQSR